MTSFQTSSAAFNGVHVAIATLVFKLAHHDKDIRIANSLAHELHASTPMLALTQQLFTASLHELGDQADYIEVAKIVAKMNGASW